LVSPAAHVSTLDTVSTLDSNFATPKQTPAHPLFNIPLVGASCVRALQMSPAVSRRSSPTAQDGTRRCKTMVSRRAWLACLVCSAVMHATAEGGGTDESCEAPSLVPEEKCTIPRVLQMTERQFELEYKGEKPFIMRAADNAVFREKTSRANMEKNSLNVRLRLRSPINQRPATEPFPDLCCGRCCLGRRTRTPRGREHQKLAHMFRASSRSTPISEFVSVALPVWADLRSAPGPVRTRSTCSATRTGRSGTRSWRTMRSRCSRTCRESGGRCPSASAGRTPVGGPLVHPLSTPCPRACALAPSAACSPACLAVPVPAPGLTVPFLLPLLAGPPFHHHGAGWSEVVWGAKHWVGMHHAPTPCSARLALCTLMLGANSIRIT
jgi:hypothetical protein